MIIKQIIATEKQSSTTHRYTPFDVGILFSKIPPDRLSEFFKGIESTDFFRDDLYKAKRDAIMQLLTEHGD
ncbi:MAG TPA: hypothetical protein ENI84_01110 [Thiothrix sp.]|nr:hypothetical protein [Thiothrix sp.]